jgi:adenylosuccinate lyase
MKGLQVYPERMRENMDLTKGLVFSQRVMLALIDKGLSREQAYKMVQRNAMRSWKEKHSLLELLKNDPEVTGSISESELESIFDYGYFLRYVDELFERVGLA